MLVSDLKERLQFLQRCSNIMEDACFSFGLVNFVIGSSFSIVVLFAVSFGGIIISSNTIGSECEIFLSLFPEKYVSKQRAVSSVQEDRSSWYCGSFRYHDRSWCMSVQLLDNCVQGVIMFTLIKIQSCWRKSKICVARGKISSSLKSVRNFGMTFREYVSTLWHFRKIRVVRRYIF